MAEGAAAAGKEAVLKSVSEVSADELKDLAGFALGCPAMGDEVSVRPGYQDTIEKLR